MAILQRWQQFLTLAIIKTAAVAVATASTPLVTIAVVSTVTAAVVNLAIAISTIVSKMLP